MTSNTTRICIVRHGETDWNAQKRIQGQIDVPLNAAGRAQAVATAAGVAQRRFEAIYSSDLSRAWQTGGPIAVALGLPLRRAVGLRERHYGRMQGLTGEEARQRFPALHAAYARRDPHHDLDGGETLSRFAARVAETLDEVAAVHPSGKVLMIAHGGVLDIVYRLATGRELSAPRDFAVPNAALNWLERRDDAWHVVAWGEQAHLAATLDEVAQ